MRFKGGRGMAIIIGSLLGINTIMAMILYSLYIAIYLKVKDGGPAWIISSIISLFFSTTLLYCYLICLFLVIAKRITGNSISNNYKIIVNRIIFDRDI